RVQQPARPRTEQPRHLVGGPADKTCQRHYRKCRRDEHDHCLAKELGHQRHGHEDEQPIERRRAQPGHPKTPPIEKFDQRSCLGPRGPPPSRVPSTVLTGPAKGATPPCSPSSLAAQKYTSSAIVLWFRKRIPLGPTICASAGVTAANLITTLTCKPWPAPGSGLNPHCPKATQVPRSPPPDSVHVRTAKHAMRVPENTLGGHPKGSPQVCPALVQVPWAWPGPVAPQAVTVLGIPLFGSSRSAEPMPDVSEIMPIRAPARAAPAASIDSQYARPTSTVSSTN